MGRRLNKGFTLVEMTIVFVIMSLMMTAGIAVLSSRIDSSRQESTKKNQEAIKQALISFISRNNRLPCPAVRTLTPGAAGYGAEAATPGTCTGTASSGAAPATVVSGIIPFSSLGLSDDTASDGFFNRLTYQVVLTSTALPAPGSQTVSGMRGYITVHSSGPGVAGAAPAGNQTNDCSVAGYNPCAAVAVILSHGKNGFGAFTTGGTQIPVPGGADELANTDDDNRFVRKDFSGNAANPFDDVLMAFSPAEILAALTQNGVIKDFRAEMNTVFSTLRGSIESAAIASRNQNGGAGLATFTLPPAISPTNDSWGNPIIYTRFIAVGIGAATTPGTAVAYSLTSLGPDGALSADDNPVTVTVAELQGLFARTGF